MIRDRSHTPASGKNGVVVAFLALVSLVLVPLITIAALRLARWAEFRAARGPGVPPTVPEAWLRAARPHGGGPAATA